MSMYSNFIMEDCGVDKQEARIIEKVMRSYSPTLDSLTPAAFKRLALRSQRDLKDPDIRELYLPGGSLGGT